MDNVIYHDVTMPYYTGMTAYTGDSAFEATHVKEIAKGDLCTLSSITMGSHTGTHVDAPAHFIKGGKTIEQLPLEHFCGEVSVYEIPDKFEITADDLSGLPIEKDEIVFFKTRNSQLIKSGKFDPSYTYLTKDAAELLAERQIKTVGIDYLSIDKFGDYQAHHALLGAGIVIIEGLMLEDIAPGEYYLASVPMKIVGGNGAPIGVVLVEHR